MYLKNLKEDVERGDRRDQFLRDYYMYLGYREHYDDPVAIARAHAVASLFVNCEKCVYPSDLVVGSLMGVMCHPGDVGSALLEKSASVVHSYGMRGFLHNVDHYAPNHAMLLQNGIGGMLQKIAESKVAHANDQKKQETLCAFEITLNGFSCMIAQYAEAAERAAAAANDPQKAAQLRLAAEACRKVSRQAPETFREALQLTWLIYIAFLCEGRYAMSFGRLDQYLYPFYERDIQNGTLTREFAKNLVECTLYKIREYTLLLGPDDVSNIAIGGVRPDGSDAVNELSYIILESVRDCAIAGPNLSARLHSGMDDRFLDECLKVIGTGIGYPALMNDDVNVAALARNGYDIEDCRNYCMVGCIENFLPGQQPPWSDDRYNSPKFLELTLNDGYSWLDGFQMGPHTGKAEEIVTMEDFMSRLHTQMAYGAAEYMAIFRNENDRFNRQNYTDPFLSCLSETCIERGLDIHSGGMKYPSAHAPGCMGIATIADSLAAIEQLVFVQKTVTLPQLRDALMADFEGYESLHRALLDAPKYGNDDDRVDKYAVWFLEEHYRLFQNYSTPDGGPIYIAIASNVDNIPAGKLVAATPDGRRCREPLSDAASPMHGMDTCGPTATVLSTTKPNYTLAACGTVLNQKYSPDMFDDPEKRAKLAAVIRVYIAKGGQEMQINSVSRETLKDAMEHPENYGNLVVRVSGFSARFVTLSREVQEDILKRTEQTAHNL